MEPPALPHVAFRPLRRCRARTSAREIRWLYDHAGMRRVQRELASDPRYAQRAVIAYLLGERDATYALLRRAVEAHDGDLLWVLSATPYLYPLRTDAPYEALLRRVGLPLTRPS